MGEELLRVDIAEGSSLPAWAQSLTGTMRATHCRDGASSRSRGRNRHRGLFPLPLPLAGCQVLSSVQTQVGSPAASCSSCPKLRGHWCWFILDIIALNWMSFGCCNYIPEVLPSKPNLAQEKAWGDIWAAAGRLVAPDKVGEDLPLSPDEPLHSRTKGASSAYFREDVVKACKLTAEQVTPGLPPAELGGRLPLLDGLSGDMSWYFGDPERCRLPEAELPADIPKPKVMVESNDMWIEVVQVLQAHNIVDWTELCRVPRVRGQPLLQGAFGVVKPGKLTKSGLGVLRLIMDCRATNAVMLRLLGDLETMAGGTAILSLIVLDTEVAVFDAEDLVSAFYLLALPESWSVYFTFEKLVPRWVFGLEGNGVVYVKSRVLPMGFSLATTALQHWHRRAALGFLPMSLEVGVPGLDRRQEIRQGRRLPLSIAQGPRQGWKIFLDDFLNISVSSRAAARYFRDVPGENQLLLRSHYEASRVPRGLEKAIEGETVVKHLGYVYDGDLALARLATGRCLELCSIGFALLEGVTERLLHFQVFAGKAAHGLQLRRPLWSTLSEYWRAFESPWLEWKPRRLSNRARSEVLALLSLLPLCESSFGGGVDPLVTASDASEGGLGVSRSTRLSDVGREFVQELFASSQLPSSGLPHVKDDLRYPVIFLISLFDGIGGIRRAAERLRLSVPLYLTAECCPHARRVVRAAWPGVLEYDDVARVTRSVLGPLMVQAAEIGCSHCVVTGGWPCQDLSRLNKNRVGIEGARSSLYREFVRIAQLAELLAGESQLRFLGIGECTRMDLKDQLQITADLGWCRTELCSSGSSRVNRPRNYWTSPAATGGEEFTVWSDRGGQRGQLAGPVEPSCAWLLPGWTWRGEEDPSLNIAALQQHC